MSEPIHGDLDGELVVVHAHAHSGGAGVVVHIAGDSDNGTFSVPGQALLLDLSEVRRLVYSLSCAHVRGLQIARERAEAERLMEEAYAHA